MPTQQITQLCHRQSLIEDLRALGLQAGDTVLAHSSLSSIGFVVGGAETFISAILEVLTAEGTLVVPTHSTDNSDPEAWKDPAVPQEWWRAIRETMPAFDARTTRSRRMGAVAETLRTWPGAVRSHHPQTSFAAVGKHAVVITQDHALDCMLGQASPLGKLESLNAKVLLAGVGFDKCTAFHLGEYRNASPRGLNSFAYMANGHRTWITVTDVQINGDDFGRLGEDFALKRQLSKGNVGAATSFLFPLAEAVNYATLWMRSNR